MAKLSVNALRGRLTSPRNHRVFKQTLERRGATQQKSGFGEKRGE